MKRSITDRIARIEQLNKEIEKIRASCKPHGSDGGPHNGGMNHAR
jgi:hypothetical protein